MADYNGAADSRSRKSVLIVGAGASGLMAALSAAYAGADVTVLEHKAEAGIKLALTGNGRCNYTNTDAAPDKYHYGDEAGRRFIEAALTAFGYKDCIDFFERLGIEPEIRHYAYDESGYVYPKGMNASGFRDVMYKAACRSGVQFRFGVSDDEVVRAVLDVLNGTHGDKSVIIAAGSNAYPVTGSDSSIYPVFRELGISLHRFLPALCALYSKDEYLKEMKGRRVKSSVTLNIYDSGQMSEDDGKLTAAYTQSGEIQFNEHSISGIPVMQLSGYAAKALKDGKCVVLSIDGHDYLVHRTAGFNRAQTCTGGIAPSDIDPHTMRYIGSTAYGADTENAMSLYLCGEIIDIDGECGGYNLHFAWATGYTAGRAAAGI